MNFQPSMQAKKIEKIIQDSDKENLHAFEMLLIHDIVEVFAGADGVDQGWYNRPGFATLLLMKAF